MAAAARAREAEGISTEGSVMDPQTPQGRRAFESPYREDPAAQPPDGGGRDRTRYAGRAMLASVVLLAAIAALIVLL